MFSALRQGSLFYILEKKEKLTLKTGNVQSVSSPVPKNNSTYPINQFGMETVVDIKVKVGDEVLEFKQLPSNLSIVNFGGNSIVVSESKNDMITEVDSILRTSQQALDSVDYHKNNISACDAILRELNPQFAKDKYNEEKISALESKIDKIADTLSKVLNRNQSKN